MRVKVLFTTRISEQADAVRVKGLQVEVSWHAQLHRFLPWIFHIDHKELCSHILGWESRILQTLYILQMISLHHWRKRSGISSHWVGRTLSFVFMQLRRCWANMCSFNRGHEGFHDIRGVRPTLTWCYADYICAQSVKIDQWEKKKNMDHLDNPLIIFCQKHPLKLAF